MFQDIRVYKGFEKVSDYYYGIHKLLQKWEEVLILWARHGNSESKKAFSFFSDYMIDRKKTWIKTKLLFNEDVKDKTTKYYQSDSNVEILFMPKWYFTPVSINIYRDCIDMLYWSENDIPSVIFIQSAEIAESYRNFFYFQWQSAKQIISLHKKWIYWDMNYIFDDFIYHSTEKTAIKSSLLNEIKYGSKVLNIWPWREPFIDELSLKNVDLTLIEKNKEYCNSYPKRPNVNIINNDFLRHTFWKTTFDYIILSHSIYYFNDLKLLRDKLFNNLTRWWKIFIILNSGGGNYAEIKEYFYSMLPTSYQSSYVRVKESLQNENIPFQEKLIWYNIYWSKDEIFNAIKIRFYDIDTPTATKNLPQLKKFVEQRVKQDQLYCENSLMIIENI